MLNWAVTFFIVALLAAILGFTGIAVAAAGIGFVFLKRGHALTEKDSILITDFVNTTADPVFDGTLKKALAVDLEQSPYLNVFPEQKIRQTLQFMGRSPTDRIRWAASNLRPIAKKMC